MAKLVTRVVITVPEGATPPELKDITTSVHAVLANLDDFQSTGLKIKVEFDELKEE